jgi:hypothetical protein
MPIPNEDESALGQQLHGHVGNRLVVQLAVPQGDLSARGKHMLMRAPHASEARQPKDYGKPRITLPMSIVDHGSVMAQGMPCILLSDSDSFDKGEGAGGGGGGCTYPSRGGGAGELPGRIHVDDIELGRLG